jgi:N-glycosylase/DNA lyase
VARSFDHSSFFRHSSFGFRRFSANGSEVKLTEILAPDFDLAMTLNSGQVFHWESTGNGFVGIVSDHPIYLEQHAEKLQIAMEAGAPATPGSIAPPAVELVKHYFALDHPLAEICRSFPNDPALNAARAFCRGLRIIRQPKWECLATFICSSMKQVAHIRQISLALRRRFGEARKLGSYAAHAFPKPERIAQSSEKALRACALGYRAKNLLATAALVSSGEADLEDWARLSDTELRAKLCALAGVGAKVANCVMLFAYERLRAFPIDVWIERALKQHYFPRKRNITPGQLRRFSESYFGDHGGYAQQYMFHYARSTSRKSAIARHSSTALRFAQNDKKGHARPASRGCARKRDPSRLRSKPTARQAAAVRSARNDKEENVRTASARGRLSSIAPT